MKDYAKEISSLYEKGNTNFTCKSGSPSKSSSDAFYRSSVYKIVLGTMSKALKKFEKGENKDYYKQVSLTRGDYTKRKYSGGNLYVQMKDQAEFIVTYLNSHPEMKNSILTVYVDLWKLLNDSKWKIAFKKAFDYCDKKPSTSVNSIKLLYISSVLAFELISLKLVDFKYMLYNGIPDITAIDRLQDKERAMMKNLVFPAISMICLCKNTPIPANVVSDMIYEEEKGLKAAESYTPELSEESLLETVLTATGKGLVKLFSTLWGGISTAGVTMIRKIFGTTIGNTAGGIALTVVVLFIFLSIPVTRLIIYYASLHKINIEKRIELEAELIGNNIVQLKEKLERTNDEKEKEKLRKIIDRQLKILASLDKEMANDLQDQNEIAMTIDTIVSNDDSATCSEADFNNSTFTLEI